MGEQLKLQEAQNPELAELKRDVTPEKVLDTIARPAC